MWEYAIEFIKEFGPIFAALWAVYNRIDKKFEKIDKRFEQIDQRFEKIESKINTISGDINLIKERLARIEGKLEQNEFHEWKSLREKLIVSK